MFKVKRHKMTRAGGKIYLVGVSLSAVLLVLLSFIVAIIAASVKNPTSMIGILALFALTVSGAISGFVTSKIKGEGGFGIAALAALTVTMLIMLLGIILCGGKLSGGTLMNCACYMGISSFSGFIAKNRPKKRRKRR